LRELSDRVAVVTGAAGGIGRALARALAAEGMHIALADLDADALAEVAEEVRARGRRALVVPTDVSKRESVEALAQRTFDELGACHLLCNNAGVLVLGPLEERSDLDWQWVVSVNLWGVVNGIQAFLPRMLLLPGERHIVNTASVSGLLALPWVGVYTATKYAVVGLSETLRADLARHGIGVSVLCPGGVVTGILQSERNRPATLGGREAGERAAGTVRAVGNAAGAGESEMLDPAEVARAVVEGVRGNELFILTHPRYRALLEERHRALLAACDTAESRGFK
jgi:NAD(P)-dependent dehydrogenase (short-subunit alcohol dehydrogenase family)